MQLRSWGGGVAVLNLADGQGPNFFSKEIDAKALQKYPKKLFPLGQRYGAWKRAAEHGVANRPMIWADHYDAYLNSKYYNEFVVPNKAFGALALSVPLKGADAFSGSTVSQLVLHRSSPSDAPFDKRHLELGRLILPAFRAAVRLHNAFQKQQEDLLDLSTHIDCGVLLYDHRGNLVKSNTILRRLLSEDPQADLVRESIEQLSEGVAELLSESTETLLDSINPLSSAVETKLHTYELRAYLRSEVVLDPTVAATLTVHRRNALPDVPTSVLMEHFSLTPQQARTAQLLAHRMTNNEIARVLIISPHTARRHTERVLAKMEVDSRFEVRALLRDLANSDSG